MEINTIDLSEKLHEVLSAKRFVHTFGVAVTAAQLAACYDFDIDKAYLAGLLHDCAKGIPGDELISMSEVYGLELTAAERSCPEALLHAKLGVCLAKNVYGVEDLEVLNSIRYHTTGRPAMGMLEKIVFTADYIEPCRKMPTVPPLNEIRTLAFNDIDAAVRIILRNTVKYLRDNYSVIDEMTFRTYDYYISC